MAVIVSLAIAMLIAMAFGIRPRALITSSMEPFIRKGSLVLVDTNTHFEDLAEGDAIVFRINSTEVLHRVTGSEGESVVAEPDNGDGEALVHKSMYVGKEIAAIPVIGGWVQWISRNAWVVVVVGAALVVIGCLPLSFRRR